MIGYIVKSRKVVTASEINGSIENGAMVIENGKIKDLGEYSYIKDKYMDLEILDYSDYIITPSLVDCHTHLLEYASTSLFPVTHSTHLMGGVSLLLKALSSGVTALGEQICGHPQSDLKKDDYLKAIEGLPIDIVFSLSCISIGLENIVNFTGVTGSKAVSHEVLVGENINIKLAVLSEYPGENLFINATPANFEEKFVPRAGEIMYSQTELVKIVNMFHKLDKKIGCHVAGKEAIEMAIHAGFDVIHHGHEMTYEQLLKVRDKNIMIVATPLGGTHLSPNKAEDIAKMVQEGITLAISTDGYLPPSQKASWLQFGDNELKGPEVLMYISNPSMRLLDTLGYDENDILKLITLNPAIILGKNDVYGSLEIGKQANFLVSKGLPGLEITNPDDIIKVFFKGDMVISK